MASQLIEIFEDQKLIEKIKRRLPYLIQLANIESSRAGKVGMEVGSVREKILIALLMYKFGEENVSIDKPITESEIDVSLFDKPISIKTISSKYLRGIKVSWTVDAESAVEFCNTYNPTCDILFVQIVWGKTGCFCYIPAEVQRQVLVEIGIEKYLKLPKLGTNPRGIEISIEAMQLLISNTNTKEIDIEWREIEINRHIYERWIELWKEDKYE